MDELLKQRVMGAVAGFNLTVIVLQFSQYFIWGSDTWGKFMYQLAISAGVGAVVAIAAFVGVQMSQK